MTNSINTNVGALVALRNLNSVNRDLSAVQNRVSTGLRVSSAQENAAVFSVAQGLRSDIRGFEAVNTSLNGTRGLLTVGIAAATSVSNTLKDVRETLTSLASDSISDEQRATFTNDLVQQVRNIENFLEEASFNGQSLIFGGRAPGEGDNIGNASSADNVNVIQNIDGDQLTVRASNLFLGDTTDGNFGFIGFARIAFEVSGNDTDAGTDIGILNQATDFTQFTARTSLSADAARAALAGVASDGSRQTGIFAGNTDAQSVFDSALAFFEREVSLALGQLGADNRALDNQIDFNASVQDAVEEGLGSLVDADLARESARLQSLQTRQQLSIQTLAIANQQPTNLLGLFN